MQNAAHRYRLAVDPNAALGIFEPLGHAVGELAMLFEKIAEQHAVLL